MDARVLSPLRALAGVLLVLTPVSANSQDAARPSESATVAARMPALSPAQIDNSLVIGGEDIGARKVATRMTVAVDVNGSGPYHFVVDSGADTSVVGRRIATRLSLPGEGTVMLNGITESRMVDRVMVDSLQVGPSVIDGLSLPVLDEHDIGGDGMIGLDALVEQRLMLDFEKRVISVDDARQRLPRLDGEIVVTARLRKGQLILTSVRAGRTSLDAIIDTGSEITIGNLALRQRLDKNLHDKFEMIEVTGVTGAPLVSLLVRVPELRIGPVLLRDAPVAFADIPPFEAFGLSGQPALLVGTDLMANFRKVSLDFRARKVRFQLRKCGMTGFRMSTTSAYATRLISDSAMPDVCSR
jgi:hypothetical protein